MGVGRISASWAPGWVALIRPRARKFPAYGPTLLAKEAKWRPEVSNQTLCDERYCNQHRQRHRPGHRREAAGVRTPLRLQYGGNCRRGRQDTDFTGGPRNSAAASAQP